MNSRIVFASVVLAAASLLPRAATAQIRVGAGLGYEFDLKQDWLHIGVEARMDVPNSKWEFNPRLLYNPGQNDKVIQADVNLLYKLDVVDMKNVVPYAGAGVLVQRYSFDGGPTNSGSETKVGINLIAGARMVTTGPISPFATIAYSVIRDQGNNMVLFVGAHYALPK